MVDSFELKRRVKEFIRENKMLEEGDGVLAAVSGGADSVCLLLVLNELKEELGIRLAAFHLNHGLRGAEADRDEAYTERLCCDLKIPFYSACEKVAEYARDNKLSEEEAGRKLRYLHLEKTAEKLSFNRIAVAHHRDDNAETVLLNLFRGSGLRGLSGIRPIRENIVRPLLCLSRKEIIGYLKEKEISWCEDSTNGENHYARNKIRNELLPWIQSNINEEAGEHILNMALLASEADEYFVHQADMLLSEGPKTRIRTEVFDRQPEVLKKYIVRAMAAAAGNKKDLSARHVEAVCSLKGPGKGTEAYLTGGLKARRGYEFLELLPVLSEIKAKALDKITVKTRLFPWKKDMEIPKNQYTKWFDYDRIRDALSIRGRENGDYFLIGNGTKKLLKRFFIDEKIPESDRADIPLLTEGSHVLWVIGYRISEYYKITEDTVNVLEVSICKGEENG